VNSIAKQRAIETAQTTAKVVSRGGALLGVFALVLGAVAAWLGGRSGTVIPTVTGLGLRASARRLP
jgi:hypothetical protein